MESSKLFLIAADLMLLAHVLFVTFVVMGLVLILVGKPLCWSWVRNPWFRVLHILAIAVVTIQSWFGFICPLTTFEMALRSRAGDAQYEESFMAHWLETILYYNAPMWAFVLCYTLFGLVVIGSWFWVRPQPFTKHINHHVPDELSKSDSPRHNDH